ncbi:hypothetical protein [Pengzhenrongella sp.]|uniref:hypothetical protein n=1 Tax=Pengzhenrongella sp. TaxID=2888820 RepID=UPI002F92110A
MRPLVATGSEFASRTVPGTAARPHTGLPSGHSHAPSTPATAQIAPLKALMARSIGRLKGYLPTMAGIPATIPKARPPSAAAAGGLR